MTIEVTSALIVSQLKDAYGLTLNVITVVSMVEESLKTAGSVEGSVNPTELALDTEGTVRFEDDRPS
eukprot:CAMPEP_0117888902 /NCGR_PEP_ID=MMETSP0950-20121206/22233_1 /TAXON_ID=44440 /ORGANISM="Chattonella subsalsa, Strain CCMP2191" /LENGTH=66 /DNA_ID=CAMNT_0005747511 /DNA_START=27 /DNA_END=224 /DNA_ORIENTATION=-